MKFKNHKYPIIIHLTHIPELNEISYEETGIRFGASVTLSEIDDIFQREIQNQPEYKTRVFTAISEMLRWFAGKQIRNVASVGGNIITGSPISDLNPLFMAANCELELKSKGNPNSSYTKNLLLAISILVSDNLIYAQLIAFQFNRAQTIPVLSI